MGLASLLSASACPASRERQAGKPSGGRAPAWVCGTSATSPWCGGNEGVPWARHRQKSWGPLWTSGSRDRASVQTNAEGPWSQSIGNARPTWDWGTPGGGGGTDGASLWHSRAGICVAEPCLPSGDAPWDLVEPCPTAAGVALTHHHDSSGASCEDAADKSSQSSLISCFRPMRCRF